MTGYPPIHDKAVAIEAKAAMFESERLSLLIGEIYDAAVDSSRWVDVLRKAGSFVGGSSASLFAKDVVAKSGMVYYQDGGVSEHYVQLYFEKYGAFDPSSTGHFFAELEQPVATADLMPYDEFLETRFYKEWAQPQGWVDFVSAPLDKTITSAAFFGVFRHERDGVVDDEVRRRMRLIVPHVRRAVLVGRLIDLKTAEAATFADALDGLSTGMGLVDAGGRIVHANAALHVVLDAGDYLSAVAGRLVASDATIDQALREAFAAADEGDAALGVRGIALSLRAKDGGAHVAHVLPLTSGARRAAGVAARAVAAFFVRKAEVVMPLPPELIAKHYGLTPTELRVLLAIVEVGGVPEVAAALGIATTTAKTHLTRLFDKTGTSRQADLVKVVAGFSMPLLR